MEFRGKPPRPLIHEENIIKFPSSTYTFQNEEEGKKIKPIKQSDMLG